MTNGKIQMSNKHHITEVAINDYLNNTLKQNKKAEIEEHLKDCGVCIEKLVFAYDTVLEFKGRKKGRSKMNLKKHIWFMGAIIAFTLSFLIPRYFIQLLVATILLGGKWIFDSANARILIMIYEAWKKGGEKEAGRILERFDSSAQK